MLRRVGCRHSEGREEGRGGGESRGGRLTESGGGFVDDDTWYGGWGLSLPVSWCCGDLTQCRLYLFKTSTSR